MNVLTRSYDNARTGANTQETQLTPGNVPGLKFLRSLKVDAGDDERLEAQPLYFSNIEMSDGVQHQGVVLICTMANNVYAFDANTGSKIWGPVKLGPGEPITPGPDPKLKQKIIPTQPKPPTELDLYGINDRWGILSTPVIDPDTQTMYVVNWSSDDGHRDSNPVHALHALKLKDGTKAHDSVIIIAASSVNANAKWKSRVQKQRAALLLASIPQSNGGSPRKTLFIASGKFGERLKKNETNPSGWVLAYDPETLEQKAAWCTTPEHGGGGIWHAGQGPSADNDGNIYVMTSNGSWLQPDPAKNPTDLSESFVKLHYTPDHGGAAAQLDVADWFTPFLDDDRRRNIKGAQTLQDAYDFQDQDLGSAAPILPTDTDLVMGAGKDGVLYVFKRDHLGKRRVDPHHIDLASNAPLLNAIFFTYFPGNVPPLGNLDFFADGKTHHLHGSPLSWSSQAFGPMLFVWGENAALRAWTVKSDGSVTFLAQSHETASAFSARFDAMPGGFLALSANGKQAGIVWATVPIKTPGADEGDANKEHVKGVLRAYDATNFSPGANADHTARINLLFDSIAAGGNQFTFNKFCPPVVADGKVFVPTYDGRVDVYGVS